MTPEQHIRANEIKAAISACKKELEKWMANDACVSHLLHKDVEATLRREIIEELADEVLRLQEEYDKL